MAFTTLQDHIEQRKREYDEHAKEYEEEMGHAPVITFGDEMLPWALQDWYSSFGYFTEEEYKYLEEVWGLYPHEVDWFTEHEEDTGLTLEEEEDNE